SSYSGSLSALQENDEHQDITYLANKTGWDARAVALASLATRFGQPTPAPATRTPAAAATNPFIRPEFYYALFRAGLPANPDTLYLASASTVEAVWNQAIKQSIIPPSFAPQIPEALSAFRTLSANASLTAKPVVGLSTVGEMVGLSTTDAAKQQQFAQLYAQHGDDPSTLWK